MGSSDDLTRRRCQLCNSSSGLYGQDGETGLVVVDGVGNDIERARGGTAVVGPPEVWTVRSRSAPGGRPPGRAGP